MSNEKFKNFLFIFFSIKMFFSMFDKLKKSKDIIFMSLIKFSIY